jgi:two-component system CheB/CheR fusion protein
MRTEQGLRAAVHTERPEHFPGRAPFRPMSKALRTLVVDDHHNAGESLGMVLRLLGCDVRVTHSGRDALILARQFRPQLVILDIMMPGLDGPQTARLMRAEAWSGRTTFVAHSALKFEQILSRYRDVSFSDYLLKPPDLDALRGIVDRIARKASE